MFLELCFSIFTVPGLRYGNLILLTSWFFFGIWRQTCFLESGARVRGPSFPSFPLEKSACAGEVSLHGKERGGAVSLSATSWPSSELDAGAQGLHRLHGWWSAQEPEQTRVPWEEQDCFKRLAEKHHVLAPPAQLRASFAQDMCRPQVKCGSCAATHDCSER